MSSTQRLMGYQKKREPPLERSSTFVVIGIQAVLSRRNAVDVTKAAFVQIVFLAVACVNFFLQLLTHKEIQKTWNTHTHTQIRVTLLIISTRNSCVTRCTARPTLICVPKKSRSSPFHYTRATLYTSDMEIKALCPNLRSQYFVYYTGSCDFTWPFHPSSNKLAHDDKCLEGEYCTMQLANMERYKCKQGLNQIQSIQRDS